MSLSSRSLPFLALSSIVLLALAAPASAEVKKTEKGMTYSIKVPSGWRDGLLVLAFHGSGDTHGNFLGSISGMVPGDALLVVPEGENNGSWQDVDKDKAADLLRQVQAEYRPSRTLAFGFSAGCYMAYIMAFAYPDMIQGSVNCSGGLTVAPDIATAKRLAFYVIHGDADKTNSIDNAIAADRTLESAGIAHKLEKLPGVGHALDSPAVKRGFEWLATTLDKIDRTVDAEFIEKIKAAEKLLKEKNWEEGKTAIEALAGAPRRLGGKIAPLLKPHLQSTNEPLALAAIAAAGRIGQDGVPLLRSVPASKEALANAAAAALGATGSPSAAEPLQSLLKVKLDSVALSAAKALEELGGDAAINALVAGLMAAEGSTGNDVRRGAIVESLRRLTGQPHSSSKDWKRWLAERKAASEEK